MGSNPSRRTKTRDIEYMNDKEKLAGDVACIVKKRVRQFGETSSLTSSHRWDILWKYPSLRHISRVCKRRQDKKTMMSKE